MYICTCIVEREGEDFYDTLILCGPGGQLWSHRKVEPAGFEAFFIRGGGRNACVFETPIGKIGVVICFDASKAYSVRCLSADPPDILLALYSCTTMPEIASKKDKQNWLDTYHRTPQIYARHLHVPVVSCNKTGAFRSPMPMGFGTEINARFIDCTSIVDKNGTLLSEIDSGPGIALATVNIGVASADNDIEAPRGRWFLPISHFTRLASEITQKFGMLRYATSRKRSKAASEGADHEE